MDKKQLEDIANELENVGEFKKAKSIREYMVKIALFEKESPFIDSSNKARRLQERSIGGDTLSPQEYDYLKTKTPIGKFPSKLDLRSTWGKLKADPKFNIGPFNEDTLLSGVSYRDPSAIRKPLSLEDISRLWETGKMKWPPTGAKIPGGTITDVDPYHPEENEREYDPLLGIDIGYIPEGNEKYLYGDIQEFGDEFDFDIDNMILDAWVESVQYYGNQIDSALSKFNKNIEDFLPKYKMLQTNFITQTPGILCGNADNVFDADISSKYTNLASTIKRRIEVIVEMMKSYNEKLESSKEYAEKQTEYFIKFRDDVNNAIDIANGNPDIWLKKLLLIYGNDMDLVIDNPLELSYDNPLIQATGFIENIIIPYQDTKRAPSTKKDKEKEEVTWETLFKREFEPITVSGPEAAIERKVIQDVDIWDELVSLEIEKPSMHAQVNVILKNYKDEIKYLLLLLNDLQNILDSRNKIISIVSGFDDVDDIGKIESRQPYLKDLDFAIMSFFRTLTRHYKSHDIVTNQGKLSGRYGVGNEAKLEIYLKGLYLAKAYNAWRNIESIFPAKFITDEEEPSEIKTPLNEKIKEMESAYLKRTKPLEINMPSNKKIDDIEAFEAGQEDVIAFKNGAMLKYSLVFDSCGLYQISDIIEQQIKVD